MSIMPGGGRKLILGAILLFQLATLWSPALGQRRASDTCEQCEGHPDSCRRLAGLYTVTVLKQGTYNPVVDIPAQACSVNITELAPSKNYLAVRTQEGDNIVNSLWLVGQAGRYRGAGTVFDLSRGVDGCPGKCITAPGPTNRRVIVQVFPKSKNPGIAYSFVLPNDVPFQPFDRAAPRQSSSSSSSSSASSSSSSSISGPSERGRGEGERSEFGGERVSESAPYVSSEGRQHRVTSEVAEPRRHQPVQGERASAERAEGDRDSSQSNSYYGSSYGSHTLGGRGQSYTYHYGQDNNDDDDNDDDDDAERDPGRRPSVQERNPGTSYVPRRSGVGSNSVYQRPSSPSFSRRRPSFLRRQIPTSSSSSSQPQQPRYISAYDKDHARGYRTSASASRGGLVDRTYSRSVEPDNRLQVFERPLEQRPALSIGVGAGGNEFEWTISGLSECSLTCGGGTQETQVVCVLTNSATQVVVTPDNCQDSLKPRVQRVACNNMPCPPGWVTGEWSECSVTCGGGTQARRTECRQRFSPALDLSVSASQCLLADKPAVSQQCNNDPCSRWITGSWGECSAPCGGGERRRTVDCVDEQGVQIPAAYCPQDKPADSERCNVRSCESQWWHTHWSDECSADCGEGVTSRHVLCADSEGRPVSESACSRDDRPQISQRCQSSAGCGTVWFTGPWSKCSDSCGAGHRSRQVLCLRTEGVEGRTVKVVGEEQCPQNSKPPSREECLNSVCDSQYYMTGWTQCSVTCGRGVKTREVRCLNVQTQQPSSSCDPSHVPHEEEECQLSPCPVARSNQDRLIQDEKCKDTFWNCRIVVQARLCYYDYYRQECCAACLKQG